MATTKLGFEIYAITTIPERADVGYGSEGELRTSETIIMHYSRMAAHSGKAVSQFLICYHECNPH